MVRTLFISYGDRCDMANKGSTDPVLKDESPADDCPVSHGPVNNAEADEEFNVARAEGTSHLSPVEDADNDQRKSQRERKLTMKAKQNLEEEVQCRIKKVCTLYEQWRKCAHHTRKKLLTAQSLEQLQKMQEGIETSDNAVQYAYEHLRKIIVPPKEVVAMVDNCGSISSNLIGILMRRRLELPDEFSEGRERAETREMKCAHPSIFGHSVSEHTAVTSRSSELSSVSSLRVKVAAEKIERLEAVKALEEEQSQRTKLRQLQMKLDEEKMKLEVMQAKAAVRAVEAKSKFLEAAEVESQEVTNSAEREAGAVLNPLAKCFEPSFGCMEERLEMLNPQKADICGNQGISTATSHQGSDIAMLAKVFSDSIAASRLPVPVPRVFSGNPLEFLEFERSFQTLVENRGISPPEKLYYLKQYVSGSAKDAIEGFFFGTTEVAYQGAWKTLKERFGQQFKIRQALRDKLEKWPKIGGKDSVALQKFSDFLKGCLDAMPHVQGLSILDDCLENQKLLSKLPEWLVTRWNRTATDILDSSGHYPGLAEFVSFMLKESRIASNPISSLSAIKNHEQVDKNKTSDKRESKGSVGMALVTKTKEEFLQRDHWQQRDIREQKRMPKPCSLCSKADHYLEGCPEFVAKALPDRKEFIKVNGLCFGCLRKGHRFRECKKKQKCGTCSKLHPTVLHEERVDSQNANREVQSEVSVVSHTLHSGSCNSTSMIVPVWVSSACALTSEILTYALLDTPSDSSFILEHLAQSLPLESHSVKLKLSTMVSSSIVECSAVSNLLVRGMNLGTQISINRCYTQDFIPVDRSHIPTTDTAVRWPHLQDIVHEMPKLQGCYVGMLIGYNCPQPLAPKRTIMGREDEPYAIQTDLGWSIVGYAEPRFDVHQSNCHRIKSKEVPFLAPSVILKTLEADFSERRHEEKAYSQEDVNFIRVLESNITQDQEGHLEMPLPFKQRPELPNNRKLAVVRLEHLAKKMRRDEKYRQHYTNFMQELFDCGYAEKVFIGSKEGHLNYIPHHGVYHAKKQDKIRVVFDCSAKFAGFSLNDFLLKGPDLTNCLIGVLCRFRQHQVALMCDVEKMFYQFRVSVEDRDYLRFLWWENGDTASTPIEYRMKVHLFGAASSPGCANYGLKYLAKLHQEEFPYASKFVTRNFYVDDGLTSVQSTEEGTQLAEEARELCKKGGLRLHKFVSNDCNVMKEILPSERAINVVDLNIDFDKMLSERALGIMWNVTTDTFYFKVSSVDKPVTRRGILSVVASLYDPLGLIAPVILEGKKILQELCRGGMKWDDDISDDLRSRWERWCKELRQLENLEIPRCYHPADFGKIAVVELHHFSDASTTGYGQCSYLRLINQQGNVHCALIFAKSRVAPTKVVTIPRLELTAAVVSVKVCSILKSELEYENIQEFFWTDSKVVLGYINNEARRFHTFVANRVQLIRQRTTPDQWRYVSTTENPADHASRGLSPAHIGSSNWFTGSAFLWDQKLRYEEVLPELSTGDPQVKVCSLLVSESNIYPVLERLEKYSSWELLRKVVARLQRRARGLRDGDVSTVEERQKAEVWMISQLQLKEFKKEISMLSRGLNIPKENPLFKLDPVVVNDILRVGGRLRNADCPFEVRHPVILPRDSHISILIIRYYHRKTQHSGKNMTLNALRENGYWIVGGGKAVSSFIHKCVECRRKRRPLEEQRMADLPEDRVKAAAPFVHTGMDCFGPIIVKEGRKEHKRYGLLFTCKCSRAVHIETLDDMSTDCFINGLRCFIALRGAVSTLHSDRGSNFIGAVGELKEAMKQLDSERIKCFLYDQQCSFEFNPPQASHCGGIWERQIRTVKNILATMLREAAGRLDTSSLRTLLYEVSSIVNSRPLATNDLHDPTLLEPLTPNHILTMKSKIASPPPGTFVQPDLYIRKRWRKVQYLCEQFWSRWRREYLANIQLRCKWHTQRKNLKVGDVVLLKDEEAPRNKWPLARVVEVVASDDNLVRKVKIMLPTDSDKAGIPSTRHTILERPVQKLVLLLEE